MKELLEKEIPWLIDRIGLPEKFKTNWEQIPEYIKDNYGVEIKTFEWKYNPERGEEDIYNRDGWMYTVVDLRDNNITSHDFRVFLSEEEAMANGITEGLACIDLYKIDKMQLREH